MVRCALGKRGVVAAREKREGDGRTPLGVWRIREVRWRADRGPAPETTLPSRPLAPVDGWCDDPADPAYNRPVRLPYAARCERLWRDDEVYDYLAVLGHNDDPPLPGLGSAVFLHVARPGFPGTDGCVALARADLLELLRRAGGDAAIAVTRA
jgi:L,D-peptidoglycan transpeptidase YkuD (ErfK/YbiS/YcfS/YnhG family)